MLGAASRVAAAAAANGSPTVPCPVSREWPDSSGADAETLLVSVPVPARLEPAVGGCAAHGDTLATRDSPRQCATTRPRVDTPDQLNIAAGIQRERENLQPRET